MPNINLVGHAKNGDSIGGAGGQAEQSGPPVFEALIADHAGGKHRKGHRPAPFPLDDPHKRLKEFVGSSPGGLRAPDVGSDGPVQDKGGGTLRVTGGEERALRSPLRGTEQGGALGAPTG